MSSLKQISPGIAGAATLTDAKQPDLPEWLRERYPFRTRSFRPGTPGTPVESARHAMSFIEEGAAAAAPVVLVHGNRSWSFLFRNLIPRLSHNYRVIAPDHIGFGLSDKPAGPAYHTLRQHIANFSALMDALGLRQATLVAHGWGGPIALGYASAHPGNVARLVLVNTWAGNLPNLAKLKVPLALRIASSGRIGTFLDNLLKLSLSSSLSSCIRRPLSDWILEGYCYPFPNPASRIAIHAFTRMFFEPDAQTRATQDELLAGLKTIEAPAEILYGAHDPLLSKLPAYVLRDNLRHAAEPVFLDAAHYIPEDTPDELAETILRSGPQANDSAPPANVFKILG